MLSVMSNLRVLGGDVALCHDWKGESSVAVPIRITFMRIWILLFTLMQIHIRLSTLMRYRIRIRILIEVTQIIDHWSADPPRFLCKRPRPSIFSLYSSWILNSGSCFPWALIRTHIDPDPQLWGHWREEGELLWFPSCADRGRGCIHVLLEPNIVKGTSNIIYCRCRTAPSAPAADLSFQKRNEEVDLSLLVKKRRDFLPTLANILTF